MAINDLGNTPIARKKLDLIDQITARLSQAEAFAIVITGEGFENFATLRDDMQNTYLLALQEQISEAHSAFTTLQRNFLNS